MKLMADRKRKKKASFGPIFWVAVILLFIILFLINKKEINANIEKFGLASYFKRNSKEVELISKEKEPLADHLQIDKDIPALVQIEQVDPPKQSASNTASNTASVGSNQASNQTPSTAKSDTDSESTPSATSSQAPSTSSDTKASNTASTVSNQVSNQASSQASKPSVETRDARLWFLKIDADGNVSRIEVVRSLPKSDSPLTDALYALLSGTTSTDKAKGLRSLIPEGTKLRSVTVKDGIAYINLSDEFQFSGYGIEGYLGQLAQIVYTATTFSTVKSVQFLIEGQRKEFLGAEGVWIGTPLNRDLF